MHGSFFDEFVALLERHLIGGLYRELEELRERVSSVESGQDALNDWVAKLSDDVTAVANQLATVMQELQSGNLTADQVNAALSPIHTKLSALVTPAGTPVTDPTTTTDPTNSPVATDPVVNPAPDAPTDEPTPDPTVNPVDIPADNLPPADDSTDTTNTNDFREDV